MHSPFVFDFITKAKEVPVLKEIKAKIDAYKKSLILDKELIEIVDYGAGSQVFTSNKREVSAIVKYAGISNTKVILLAKIISYYKPMKILELGTSLGMSAVTMSIANPSSRIISIEGCPETAKKAKHYIKEHYINNVDIIIGKFSDKLPNIYKNQTFDLIYFDGNHQKQATINYFDSCLSSVHNETLLIFDDIHWSKEMEKAWLYIQKHNKVTVSIDVFHFGLVFFRKEQVKQHFILR